MDKMKKMLKKKALRRVGGKRGFTLVELLIVMTIIAILVAIVAMSLTGFLGGAKVTACEADWRSLQTAVVAFYAIAGDWPTDQDGVNEGEPGYVIDYDALAVDDDGDTVYDPDDGDLRFEPDFVIDEPDTQAATVCQWQVDEDSVGLVVISLAAATADTCPCEGDTVPTAND